MATIVRSRDKWRAQIRRVGAKSISKTFPTKAEAQAWARQAEADMDRGARRPASAIALAAVVAEYRTLRETSGREVLDTSNEHYMLKTISRWLGDKPVESLEVGDLVQYAKGRKREGAGPYTVNMEISKLGTVLRHMGAVLGLRIPDVVGQARPVLAHFNLIGGGGKRERRPTGDELERICEWLSKQTTSATKQRMPGLVRITAILGLRLSEGCRIEWADLDDARRLVLVRDRKDPRNKAGNDQWVPLIGDALAIIQRQPRDSKRIFPLHPQTVSKAFTEACRELSIPDLHFHDLRHEAASALSEAGWSSHEIRVVTGHKTSAHLERYVNLDPARVALKRVK
jgi:integrase